jgi:ergothioneine biosynthesis protein EgtB
MQPRPNPSAAHSALSDHFRRVRQASLALTAPLSPEDCQAQSMPDASPIKWHLAHTTWFFETFVLEPHEVGFQPYDPAFRVLFNSYYHGIGERHARPLRGALTRPALATVLGYREQVQNRVLELLGSSRSAAVHALVTLGCHHEQQHQELMLTDLKHLLSCNPLQPSYAKRWPLQRAGTAPLGWHPVDAGLTTIGHGDDGFAFDNEGPAHQAMVHPFVLANRPVTHGDWDAFIADGGYRDPRWWLSEGWDWVQRESVDAPLYWRADGHGAWTTFTLHGRVPVDPHTPIVHISYFEADAYARWLAAHDQRPIRLPTEFEWECAARSPHQLQPLQGLPLLGQVLPGNFAESQAFHPMPLVPRSDGKLQLFGNVWAWTSSSYAPYPGFRAAEGAVGEYNGKFMVNQQVLRGGSCATPASHIRASYRNFFPTHARWQFSGVRLACDV